MANTYIIYKATSPTGKVYIGLTRSSLRVRSLQHYAGAKRDLRVRRRLLPFQAALLKYGDRFEWGVLVHCSSAEEASEQEAFHIALYRANEPTHGYNCTVGGNTGPTRRARDEQHTRRIQVAQARPVLRSDGRPFLSARHASLEMGASTGDSVGKALRNHGSCGGFTFTHISEVEYVDALVAWEAKVAAGHQEQQPVWSMSRKGLKHTDEARANMARAKKGKERSPEHTRNHRAAISSPVIRSDGVRFLSIRDAAQAMGLTPAQITYSIKEGFPRQGFTFGFDR